jgi:amino acid adenylation domain-containing protein
VLLPAIGRETLDRSIGERFEVVAAACDQRIAIKTPRGEINYRELAAFSARIAEALGHSPSPIATLLPQGIDAIAAQLAVLRSGGCYVPLDPRDPAAALRETMRHAGTSRVLTDGRHLDLARETIGDDGTVIDVGNARTPRPVDGYFPPVGPDSPANIYYTSGSTGRPKGVVNTHRTVLHNVLRYTRNLAIGPQDRLTLLQSPAFSGAVSSTYCALLNGAMLCTFDLRQDQPDRLADWLVECGVTVYHSVPSIFRTLVAGRREFPRLRIIRLEGDRALARDAELYKAHFAATCTLVNGLGTTETGIVRQFFVSPDTDVGQGLLPVGHPVPDVEACVVGEAGEPLGIGRIGEIAVRSRYLAVSYWKDPGLTAARFLPDPGGGPERIYRTGDLGRMRADGCLEYHGRRDGIVKIRGLAVDPSEVEQMLVAIPGVKDAAVAARDRGSGDLELVALVVAPTDPVPTPASLGAALRSRLPGHMVPSAFELRESLPLTPFGKIDRRAVAELAKAVELAPAVGESVRSLRPLEREVARIWGLALGRETVAADVPFLDYGGDSLQAMRILVHLRDSLSVGMSPMEFFDLSTVELQARYLESVLGDLDPSPRG